MPRRGDATNPHGDQHWPGPTPLSKGAVVITRIRDDKGPGDADTLATLQARYAAQLRARGRMGSGDPDTLEPLAEDVRVVDDADR